MKKFVNVLFLVLFIFLFLSCEIGLGAAVDTLPPELSIESPEVNSIIRDSFLVRGTWKDDGSIKSVSLTFKRTDESGKSYGPFKASVINDGNKQGTWNCVVNPNPENGERILDGTYELEVAIRDEGEHTSTLKRQLYIDNTAPLLILQRPVTDINADDATVYEYGQNFTLKGSVYDEHKVDHIDIDVYEDAAFQIFKKRITVNNIEPALDVDVARFSEGGDYTDIYGYTSIEAAEAAGKLSALRYCKITTYDNAKRYPEEGKKSDDDNLGNPAIYYYDNENESIAALLKVYGIDKLYKMQNGTYALSAARNAETDTALVHLEEEKLSASKFRLNPKNNPTFSVSGNPETISNNSTVVVEVKQGLDSYVLLKDALRPYIIACDADGNYLVENIPGNRIYLSEAGKCEKKGNDYTFNVELIQGMEAANYAVTGAEEDVLLVNNYYLFGCEGSDIKDKPILSEKTTVFKFESNENSNTITAKYKIGNDTFAPLAQNDLYINKSAVITIEGEATGCTKDISSLISVSVNDSTDAVVLNIDESKKTLTKGYFTQPYSATIKVSNLNLENGKDYSLVVSAGTPISDESATLKYDDEKPAVIIGTPSPYEKIYLDDWAWNQTTTAEKDKRYLNQKVTVNIGISDNDSVTLAKVEFETKDGSSWKTISDLTQTISENFSSWDVSNIDTTKFIDNSPMRMKVTATDRSGNTATVTSSEYNVLQSSDNPTAVSGDSSVCLKPNPNRSSNADESELNKRSPGGSLGFILYDDDGIKRVDALLYNPEGALVSSTPTIYSDSEVQTKTYYTYKISNTLSSKEYKLSLKITDKFGVSNTIDSFPLKITAPDPVVTVVSQVDKVTTKAENAADVVSPVRTVSNTVKVVSTGAPFKIVRTIYNGETLVEEKTVNPLNSTDEWCFNNSSNEYDDSFNPPASLVSGEYSVEYKVIDVDGKTEEGHFGTGTGKFYVDNEAPVVDSITTVPGIIDTETPTGPISGTAKENEGTYQSGLRKVEYKVLNKDEAVTVNRPVVEAVETASWNATVIYENHSALYANKKWLEGQKKIAVRAVDSVGNIGAWTTEVFDFDRANPVVSVTHFVDKDNKSNSIENNSFNYGYKFSLKGKASDSYRLAESESVIVKQGDVEIAKLNPDADGNWSVGNLPRKTGEGEDTSLFQGDDETKEITEGEYDFTVIVTDIVSKSTSSSTVKMVADHTPPVLTVSMPAGTSISGSVATFGITAQDDGGTGVKSIYYAFDDKAYTLYDGDTVSLRKVLGTGTQVPANSNDLYEGDHVLHVYAVDKADNKCTVQNLSFCVDQSAPEVQLVSLTPALIDGKYLNSNTLTLQGTVKETNKLGSLKIEGPASPVNFTVGDTNDVNNQKLSAVTKKENSWKQNWKYTHTSISEGELTYTFTATDVKGKTNVATKTVFVDTVKPVIDTSKVKCPDTNDTQEDFFTFTGEKASVTENGSGIKAIEIGFSDASAASPADYYTEVSFEDAAIEGETKGQYNWSSIVQFSNFDTFKTEGPKKLWVRAIDNAGNTTAWSSKDFTYDTAAPESTLEITNPNNTDDRYRQNTFEVKGKAKDNYGIKTVKLEAIKTSVTPNVTKELTLTNDTLPGKTINWSWSTTTDELPKVNGKPDGTYTFKIIITDNADKVFTEQKEVIIDTTPPEINLVNIESENSSSGDKQQKFTVGGNNWYNTRLIKLKVTPETDDSGIDTISYTLKPAAQRSNSDWTDLTKGTYKGTVALQNDGPNTVYFRIKDNAGNVNYADTDTCYAVFNIDTTAPSITKVYDDLGNELTGEIFVDGAADANFDLFVEAAADEGNATNASGLSILKVGDAESTLVNDGSVNNGRYRISIPSAKRKTGDLVIEAYDNVNNKATLIPCRLKLDEEQPEIKLISPDYTKDLNGNITISADITDYLTSTHVRPDGKLKSIEVRYSIDATSESDASANWYVFDDGDATDHDSFYPTASAKETIKITHRFSAPKKQLTEVNSKLKLTDTDSKTSDQDVWVKIEVKDQANHKETKTFKMVVDRNSDRPVIGVNNVSMGTDMSSTNYKWLLDTTQLKGTIEDDDGTPEMYIRLASETNDDWKPVTVSGTNWNFDLTGLKSVADEAAANGNKIIYFKVVDKENNTFISNADTDDFENIYLRDGSKNYGILYVKPETMAPALEIDGVTLTSKNSFDKQYSSLCIGGEDHSFKIRFTASDANDIASKTVTATFVPSDDSATEVAPVTVTAAAKDAQGFYVATFTDITDSKGKKLKESNQAGTIELTVSVKDTYGRETQENQRVKYDYKYPEITRTAPKDTLINTGNVTAYGTITESSEVSYALSLSGTTKPSTGTAITKWTGTKADETGTKITASDTNATANVTPAYTKISNTASSWFLYFDGETAAGDDHGKLLKQFLIDSGVTYNGVACTNANIINQTFTAVVDVYLWIKAKDSVGNITETPFKIQVDSQGERPEVSIAYPGTPDEYVANTVNIYGSAKPAEGNEMANVWVQLISTKQEKSGFSSSGTAGSLGEAADAMTIGVKDLDYMAYAGYDVYNMKTYNTDKTKWVSGTSSVASGYSASDYGILIKTNGSTGWSLKINENHELDSTVTNKVGIAVYAQDAAGHISKRAAQYINFDAAKPKITNVYLKNSDGSIVKEYKDNMWISGEWYLTFTATDNQEIKTVSVGTNVSKPEGATNTEWKVSKKISDSSSSGKITTSIEVSDGDNTTTKSITLNVDNNAPAFDSNKDNIEKTVKNSNGYYSFGSKVNEPETESGIDYIAFYFLRGNDVFDVMYSQTHESNKTTIASANNTDHLRWVTSTITSAGSNTITLSAENKNAHKGGLVKVKGTIYKIEGVNGTSVTVDGNLETMNSGNVEFAIANVVDNTIKESSGGTKETTATNYAYGYGTPTLDDGDRMIEYLANDGTWTAYINSRNIKDGAVTLCCVAFDKAGNASALKTKELYVSNNAPRIAGIKIKTDKNGNDSVDDAGETITDYNAATVSANKYYDPDPETTVAGKTILDQIFNVGLSTAPFTTIKGRTEIIPEIVGGNGDITYDFHWKKADGSDAHSDLKGSSTAVVTTGATDYTAKTGNKINIQVGDLAKAGDTVVTNGDGTVTTGSPDCLTITFRDSIRSGASNALTDDDKSYQSATLNMYFNVDVIAEGKPASSIDPFYWKSATENSVYDATEKKIKGHIELPGDLPVTFTENNTDTLMDRDAKVSGQVILTGSASDAGKIIELWFHIDEMNLSGTGIKEKYKVGDKWFTEKPTSGSYDTYYCLAKEENKTLTSKAAELTLTKNTYGASKHEVEWKYIWNTENIDGTAVKDVQVKVQAVNQGTPSCTTIASGATGYATAKIGLDGSTRYAEPTYEGKNITANVQVDVVPYIKELKTTLSKANPDNSSEYGRSALGSYPVFYYTAGSTEKDSVEVIGYNIPASATIKFENYSGQTAVTATMVDSKFILPANAKTGNISVVVNGVESLNNKNSNDAKGTYDPSKLSNNKKGTYTEYRHYYNRQPNNINNDTLTDNVSLSIWSLNGTAVSVTSDLTRPVMHVNPNNGMIGFTYSNGKQFYMANGNTNSKTYFTPGWNAFNSIGFTYDSAGNTFGVEMGTDCNDSGSTSKFRIMSSLWGVGTNSQEYDNNAALRLESHNYNATRFDNHPKLAATNYTNSTDSKKYSNVYLMYYDPNAAAGNELKLRCGAILNDTLKGETGTSDGQGQNATDQFGDFCDDAYVYGSDNLTNYAHCSVVVNKDSTYKPGTEYSIAVVPGDTITGVTTDTLVAVWVDPVNNTLVYGYLSDPLSNNHKYKNGTANTSATPNDNWVLTPILTGMAGGYCAITTDKAGGVHIAYYSKERNGSLKYTYISSPTGTPQTCFVDSYGATGKNVTIDFAYNGSKYIPYIGYYNSMKKPKYAYLVDTGDADTADGWQPKAGVDASDMTTGAWETMFVSTNSSVDATDGVQIGVYRGSDGKRTAIITRQSEVGGNGTDNPVIGYATSVGGNGRMEIAQLK